LSWLYEVVAATLIFTVQNATNANVPIFILFCLVNDHAIASATVTRGVIFSLHRGGAFYVNVEFCRVLFH